MDFRQKSRQELKIFQQVIDNYQYELSRVSTQQEVEYVVRKYQRTIKCETENLQALFIDAKLSIALGTIATIFKVKALPAIAGIGVDLPLEIEIATLGVVGSVSVVNYLISRRNTQRAALRESACFYI